MLNKQRNHLPCCLDGESHSCMIWLKVRRCKVLHTVDMLTATSSGWCGGDNLETISDMNR